MTQVKLERRVMPTIIGHDIVGVAPMKGPIMDERAAQIRACRRELARTRGEASALFVILGVLVGGTIVLSLLIHAVRALC